MDINKKIVVVHYGNVTHYPPVINLLECLLENGYRTVLISEEINKVSKEIRNNNNFTGHEVIVDKGSTVFHAAFRTFQRRVLYKKAFRFYMNDGDIIWTTNDNAVAALNSDLKKYSSRHVLQLMELVNKCPLIKGVPFFTFPIDSYAQNAWKTVVPERNRAYIQKVLWKQSKLPYVLPNKPYFLDPGQITESVENALSVIENEKRKIVLYLGVVGKDRKLDCFVEAIERLGNDYCLYVIGRVVETVEKEFQQLLITHSCLKYLGFFTPPSHLHFVKYAHVALLPYKPAYNIKSQSPLNALYCAPNKIFEYAGFGVPMVGTDVLGLVEPFEKYNIGICCKDDSPESIANAISTVSKNRIEMSKNCFMYYNSVNFDEIVDRILNEKA